MDGVKNTLNRVVSAEFEIPDHLSPVAKDLIHCLLKKVTYVYDISIYMYTVCAFKELSHLPILSIQLIV